MNETIKNFEQLEQGFNPIKLYKIINRFNDEQLHKLNKYLFSRKVVTYENDLKYYPLGYLLELCKEEDGETPFLLEINYDDIWEERFKFSDLIEQIRDRK